MKIDLHNHIWSGGSVGENFLDQDMSVESLLRAMDQAEVDIAGVCSVAQDIQNDYVLAAQKAHTDRLFAYVFVNPREKNAVETLKRYLDAGMKGVKLHPRLHGYSLSNHKLVDPIMEVCREYKVPVYGHGSAEEFNMPFDFEEIARTFPDVTVILGHMGAFGAVDNAILAASRTKNLYLDTSLCASGDVKNAIRIVGPDKLLMSTDWPGSDFRVEHVKLQVACEGNPDAWKKITADNYIRLFGI